MKVAVSAFSADLSQQVNPVFGRCPGFIIAEIEEKEIKNTNYIANNAMNSPRGAGIAAAQQVASQGVQAVITGNTGPNALMVLQQTKIKIYQAAGLVVEDALKQFIDGTLPEISAATGPGFAPGAGRGMGAGKGQGMGAGRGQGMGAGRGRGPPI